MAAATWLQPGFQKDKCQKKKIIYQIEAAGKEAKLQKRDSNGRGWEDEQGLAKKSHSCKAFCSFPGAQGENAQPRINWISD